MRRNRIIPLAAVVAALAGAAPVLAAPAVTPAPERVSLSVRVADLDLQSQAGARIALRRIRHAADIVCGGEPDARELARHARFDACVRAAVRETAVHSRSPALAAMIGAPLADGVLAAAD